LLPFYLVSELQSPFALHAFYLFMASLLSCLPFHKELHRARASLASGAYSSQAANSSCSS
jgi:hypothetical protein